MGADENAWPWISTGPWESEEKGILFPVVLSGWICLLPLTCFGKRLSGFPSLARAWLHFIYFVHMQALPVGFSLDPFPRWELGWERLENRPGAQLAGGRARVCSRPVTIPHCLWQNEISMAAVHPAYALVVQARHPCAQSRVHLWIPSLSEFPSQGSPGRLPEHLKHVQALIFAPPNSRFFSADCVPNGGRPGPTRQPSGSGSFRPLPAAPRTQNRLWSLPASGLLPVTSPQAPKFRARGGLL